MAIFSENEICKAKLDGDCRSQVAHESRDGHNTGEAATKAVSDRGLGRQHQCMFYDSHIVQERKSNVSTGSITRISTTSDPEKEEAKGTKSGKPHSHQEDCTNHKEDQTMEYPEHTRRSHQMGFIASGTEQSHVRYPLQFCYVQRMMAMEGDLSKQNADGDTMLHVAIIFSTLSLVWQILHQKVDKYVYSIKNLLQQTPLHLAVLTKQPLVARKLVVRGASLNARDRLGNTPLHLACSSGDLDLVRALTIPITSRELKELDMNENVQDTEADATILNYHGESPLHLAAAQGHIQILRYLLFGHLRANVNVADGRSGRTILHHAVESGSSLVLVFLLQNRIDLCLDTEAETYSGHSAMDLAESRKRSDIVRLLMLTRAHLNERYISDSDCEKDGGH